MKNQVEGRTVLLVDDDQAVLDVTQAMLESLGFQVMATASGLNALELFSADPGRFDLVMTDIIMPLISGSKLAQQIMEIRTGIPVILFTGYSDVFTDTQAQDMGIRGLLMKPFSIEILSETIRRALAGGEHPCLH